MNRLIISIALVTILASCTPVVETSITQADTPQQVVNDQPTIIGLWERNYYVWAFYPDDSFIYYDAILDEVLNTGIYTDDGQSIHLEDPYKNQSATYVYEIIQDYPNMGDITLRWHLEGYPQNSVEYLKIGDLE